MSEFISNNMEWIFSGIGTQVLTWVVGFIIGGISGYKFATRKVNKQSQKAGKNSLQIQIGENIHGNEQSKPKGRK